MKNSNKGLPFQGDLEFVERSLSEGVCPLSARQFIALFSPIVFDVAIEGIDILAPNECVKRSLSLRI